MIRNRYYTKLRRRSQVEREQNESSENKDFIESEFPIETPKNGENMFFNEIDCELKDYLAESFEQFHNSEINKI